MMTMMNLKDWKIGTRIAAAFAIVILICCAMSYFAYNRVCSIDEKAKVVGENHVPSVAALSNVTVRSYRLLGLIRQHAASTSQQEMNDLDARIQLIHDANTADYKKYENLPSDEHESALYAKVKQDRLAFNQLESAIRKDSQIGTAQANAAAMQTIDRQLIPSLERYTDDIQAVVDYNNQGSMSGMLEVKNAVASTIRGLVICLLLAVALAVVITIYIVRSITKPLEMAVCTLEQVSAGDLTAELDVEGKDEVGQMAKALNGMVTRLNQTMQEVANTSAAASASSQQLAAASESIASGAQEQAASLEETSASLEEITATVRQSADNAGQASQLAISSKDSALQGQDVVAKAISAMEEINAASAKISDIISTIDEIAFQTNLLAVNAAVEAARAGEEGRGFAVVATEVRSLAQRSAVAAKEIKVLIQDSLHKVEAGSVLVNRSGETLQGIVDSVKRVTDIVGEIAAASNEQSTGIEQVNKAMMQMDQVTQSNSAQTEELSATAEAMSDQAANVMRLIGTFKLTNSSNNKPNGPSSLHAENGSPARQTPPMTPAAPSLARQSTPVKGAGKATAFHVKPGKLNSLQSTLAVAPASSAASESSFEEF
jgi:methyl-accepting chemotaxis protein